MQKKVRIARLSVYSNIFLILIKVIGGVLSGSVSILSEAIHSTMDLIASFVAFFSVRISDTPPDHKHPYGHGKFENVSGVVEALIIFIAAIIIIFEAIHKIIFRGTIESIGIGSFVMLLSAVVNILVSKRLYKVAKETDSLALEADALHLKTDVYTSLGVAIGLGLIWLTKMYFLDPIVAILVALFILIESFKMLKKAYTPLIDVSLDDVDIQLIEQSISNLNLKAHEIRTRRAGNYKFVDMHLEMDPEISLKRVHELCDMLEQDLKQKIANLDINIHVEPLDNISGTN
jgi:cation diffusion facilitator family transporter